MPGASKRSNGIWTPGVPEPGILWLPKYVSSTGTEAIEVCELAGIGLDDWQGEMLHHSLGEQKGGKWAAFEVACVIPRQNGKTLLTIAREIVGLFLLGERLIIHSAHQFDTSLEAFRSLVQIIEETPEFDRQVKKVSRSHGEEGIELRSGQRIRFRTRTKGGGRGFTADCLILDEAMILPESTVGALMPTLSARPNPQVWYCGSAVDQEIHEDGIVLARLRERAKAKDPKDGSLAYFEYGLTEYDHPSKVPAEIAAKQSSQEKANPAMPKRISVEHVERERNSLDERTFAVERLNVGDWPDPEAAKKRKITPVAWAGCTDYDSSCGDPIAVAWEVSEDRSAAAIAICGQREDGLAHIEVVAHRPSTGWVAAAIKALAEKHNVLEVRYAAASPAAALAPDVEALGVECSSLSQAEMAGACGMIFDSVAEQTLRHLGTPELQSAVAGATAQKMGDRWVWSRVSSHTDISPLAACTVALWTLRSGDDVAPEVHSIRDRIEQLRKEREGVGSVESVESVEQVLANPLGDDRFQRFKPI